MSSTTAVIPVIEGFWLRNFKGIEQLAVGASFQQSMVIDGDVELSPYELTPLTTFIGNSGTGKSTLLDAFAFVADILNDGLDRAVKRRGGFDELHHRSGEGFITLGIVYRACSAPVPLTYYLNIEKRGSGANPCSIETEALIYRSSDPDQPTKPLMLLQNGEKQTRFLNPWPGVDLVEIERIKRTDAKTLALNALGEFDELPDVPQLKQHLNRFHLACYTPDNAAGLISPLIKLPGERRLATEFKRMEERHPQEFSEILKVIAHRMPRVEDIFYEKTEAGRTVLYFRLPNQPEPFPAHMVGEGMLRLFAHLLLFEDPIPVPLIGMDEPNAHLDDPQLQILAGFAREHAREMGGSQFFITTTQSSLADYMDPTEVWILYKDNDGVTRTCRALDELSFQNIDLDSIGPGWYTDHIFRKSY